MDWLLPAIVGLFTLVVFGWLALLTLRLNALGTRIDQSQKRQVSNERLKAGREQDEISGLRDQVHVLQRDFRSIERELADIQVARSDRSTSSPLETHSSGSAPQSNNSAPSEHVNHSMGDQSSVNSRAAEILEKYNELAANFEMVSREAFIETYSPTIAEFEGASFRQNEGGKFWLVEIEGANDALVFPIGKVARDWEKLYRAMNGLAAQDTFGLVFDVRPGGRLKIEVPALSARLGKGGALLQKGIMSGI